MKSETEIMAEKSKFMLVMRDGSSTSCTVLGFVDDEAEAIEKVRVNAFPERVSIYKLFGQGKVNLVLEPEFRPESGPPPLAPFWMR